MYMYSLQIKWVLKKIPSPGEWGRGLKTLIPVSETL
jgi:hypothetical protein